MLDLRRLEPDIIQRVQRERINRIRAVVL